MTTIAALTAADRDEWLRLWDGYLTFYEQVLPAAVTEDVFERLTAGAGIHGAIARDEHGHAVGLVHWLFHPSTWTRSAYCYLEDLYVAPDSRGGGVGRALIAHVRERAHVAGAAKVYWLTEETNITARTLYDQVADLTGFVHYETDMSE
ncbi:GNAT family N-acetyltransferase [uncultured Amnibacterium sp.]|uniref:GNAT family N-acetyltransferase n=1 Tax=uncultured Amnibacterium sp. TaxID=1631851 RepID=UPI0035C9F5E5